MSNAKCHIQYKYTKPVAWIQLNVCMCGGAFLEVSVGTQPGLQRNLPVELGMEETR